MNKTQAVFTQSSKEVGFTYLALKELDVNNTQGNTGNCKNQSPAGIYFSVSFYCFNSSQIKRFITSIKCINTKNNMLTHFNEV